MAIFTKEPLGAIRGEEYNDGGISNDARRVRGYGIYIEVRCLS